MPEDWFRNKTWSPTIESAFQAKLKRCRTQGPQYLYIQASTLSKSQPRITLRLLEQYFATDDHFNRGGAFTVQAEALAKLGLIEEAIASHKESLAWEQEHPHVASGSGLALAYLIARSGRRSHYEFAISTLQSPKIKLIFPIDLFITRAQWH